MKPLNIRKPMAGILRHLLLGAVLSVLISAVTSAQQSGLPFVLPQSFEMDAALAAAPEVLRADAGIYLLGTEGFYRHRTSGNGYNCIVERNPTPDPGAVDRQIFAPMCHDEPGSESRLAMVVEKSKLVRKEGLSLDNAKARLAGDKRPFAAYPPHVMFLAPNRDDESVNGGLTRVPGGMLTGWPFLPGPARDDGLIVVPLDRGLQDLIVAEQSDLVKQLNTFIPYRRLYLP